MENLRDAAVFLSTAVEKTIDALDLQPEDAAAVQLARHYAATIDQIPAADVMRYIGPLLMDALKELGATPAARARIKNARSGGDASSAAPVNWLDQQRQSRTTRRA